VSKTIEPGRRKALARLPWGRVALTPIEAEDLEKFHDWQNDAGLRDITMGFRFPVPRERVRDWIAGMAPQGVPTRAVYAVRCDGALVGSTQLFDIQPVHRTAGLGTTIAARDLRALGVGHVATALILDFAFRGLDLRRVEAETIASNTPTINTLKHLGFTHEGTRRQGYYADGVARDTLNFGLLREEFALWPPAEAHRLCRSFDSG
jgi:RimJ/RimL family protein N-acetyltransferase